MCPKEQSSTCLTHNLTWAAVDLALMEREHTMDLLQYCQQRQSLQHLAPFDRNTWKTTWPCFDCWNTWWSLEHLVKLPKSEHLAVGSCYIFLYMVQYELALSTKESTNRCRTQGGFALISNLWDKKTPCCIGMSWKYFVRSLERTTSRLILT